jgi:uncharacterized protein (TIGR03083 family)
MGGGRTATGRSRRRRGGSVPPVTDPAAPALSPDRYVEAIRREAGRMAAAVDAGAGRPVTACPGWDVAALAAHTGSVFRWAGEIVRTRATERVSREPATPAGSELAPWLVAGADEVAVAIAATDPDTPMWTMGPPRNARYWGRRQAEEALVHRWDAEQAVRGDPEPLDADLAADGVAEMLGSFVPRLHRRAGVTGDGESFHFHRTDGPGEWLVRFGPAGAEVSAEHAKGDIALRGSAEDLLLVLWRRRSAAALEVFGDRDLLRRWEELVPAI